MFVAVCCLFMLHFVQELDSYTPPIQPPPGQPYWASLVGSSVWPGGGQNPPEAHGVLCWALSREPSQENRGIFRMLCRCEPYMHRVPCQFPKTWKSVVPSTHPRKNIGCSMKGVIMMIRDLRRHRPSHPFIPSKVANLKMSHSPVPNSTIWEAIAMDPIPKKGSLTLSQAIWGWFLLKPMIPVRSQWGRW